MTEQVSPTSNPAATSGTPGTPDAPMALHHALASHWPDQHPGTTIGFRTTHICNCDGTYTSDTFNGISPERAYDRHIAEALQPWLDTHDRQVLADLHTSIQDLISRWDDPHLPGDISRDTVITHLRALTSVGL